MTFRPILLACAMFALSAGSANAYSADDTLDAIEVASAETGVSAIWLYRVVGCETGWTFRPSTIGDHGTSYGAAQLHRGGELEHFYALGYTDPMNPYEALDFMGRQFANGRASRWSCR